jgi:hypothetical protein
LSESEDTKVGRDEVFATGENAGIALFLQAVFGCFLFFALIFFLDQLRIESTTLRLAEYIICFFQEQFGKFRGIVSQVKRRYALA